MRSRKPRGVRPDELELWTKATANTVRLQPMTHPPEQNRSLSQPKKPEVPLPRFRVGEAVNPNAPEDKLAPSIGDHVASQPLAMDRKRFGKMKKGRLAPDARIDLHGMTQAQAHPRLTRFILDSVADGHRFVLVITGKGKVKPDHGPMPERLGVLRHQVPHWLNSMPLKRHVLQITEAHIKHGGQGAYYVYLRRPR